VVVGEEVEVELVVEPEPFPEEVAVDVTVAVADATEVVCAVTVDPAEEVVELELLLLGLPPISTNSPTVAPSPSSSQHPDITRRM
jgi:hypothetical protein